MDELDNPAAAMAAVDEGTGVPECIVDGGVVAASSKASTVGWADAEEAGTDPVEAERGEDVAAACKAAGEEEDELEMAIPLEAHGPVEDGEMKLESVDTGREVSNAVVELAREVIDAIEANDPDVDERTDEVTVEETGRASTSDEVESSTTIKVESGKYDPPFRLDQ